MSSTDMHQYTKLLVHIVFSTADRRPLIRDSIRTELHAYLAGIARNIGCEPIEIGGYNDHVHCLIRRPPVKGEAEIVGKLKSNSSRWVRRKSAEMKKLFAWQRGYGAFSVSESNAEAVAEYIRRQPEHHRQASYQDEIRRLFARHGLPVEALP